MPNGETPEVRIEPWADGDLDLLRETNSREMKEHLGGPETEEQIVARHQRYLATGGSGTGRMFSIVLLPERRGVGTIGYWERVWKQDAVYETGWSVLRRFQGRGIAAAATEAVVSAARAETKHRYIHAFPSVDNPASNAICRKLNFTLLEECDFEFPPGHLMRCNNWRLDLTAGGDPDNASGGTVR
jgi:RimJ/RimL family protein N-acetyltransferase